MTATHWAQTAARRVMARCDVLGHVSSRVGSIERVYLSPEHARANALAAGWMHEVGMDTWQDAAGNQRGRVPARDPEAPWLLLGSHLDTVVDAGRYDGMLGVVMAIEVVAGLRESIGDFPFGIEVVAFSDEEGTRFGKALLGSCAAAGIWDESWWDLVDGDGVSVRTAFARFGLNPSRIDEARLDPARLVGYLEAHIEQGPYLELADQPLGVVTSIAAARRFTFEMLGEARHAGGTPYEHRHDALLGASEAALAVERICKASHQIGTVGQLRAYPGGVNVIPGRVTFSLDVRGESDTGRDEAWAAIAQSVDEITARRGLTWSAREVHNAPAVRCAPHLQDALRRGVEWAGQPQPLELFSKAGHDAMSIAAVTDIGMLFLRNPGGISHSPDESVSQPDVALGLDALTYAVLDLAGQAPPPRP